MQFATCEWNRAVEFLQKIYPTKTIDENKILKLKKLVEEDILRIEDPDLHKPAKITAGKNYDSCFSTDVNDAVKEFRMNVHNA